MKNYLYKIKDYYVDILIILNIIYILIGSLLYTIRVSDMRSMASGFVVLEVFNFIILLLHFFKYKFNKIDIPYILIIIFSLISVCFAFNQYVALYGTSRRYEGLFSILYYLSLFGLSTFSKNKKLIIFFILLAGISPFIYSFCSHHYLINRCIYYPRHNVWTNGYATNRNFYGSFMLMCLSYSLGLYVEENDEDTRFIYLLLCFLFSVGLLYSNTLSCFIGFFGVVFVLFIYCIKNKRIKRFIFLLVIFLSIFTLMINKNSTNLHKDLSTANKEAVNITKGKIEDNYGSYRAFILKEAIVEVPKYLLTGVGIDNFGFIKDGYAIRLTSSRGVALFDKAHCEYLQYLITGGIFYFLSFLSLYILVLVNGFKLVFKDKKIYLLLPIIGYLIQALFNISVIEVAPFFFISMGLVLNRDKRLKKIKN